jgi:Secretion system C-terminal sorting domain/Fibronectin type III domain
MRAARNLILLLVGISGLPEAARAQVADYVFSQQTNATWTPLVNPTIIADASDGFQIGLVARPPFTGHQRWLLPNGTIPFPFVFNGHTYTGMWVAQSGYVTLGPNPPHMGEEIILPSNRSYDLNHPLSQTVGTDYEGVISVMGGILGPANQIALGPAGYLQYKTVGTAPNRTFVVEWLRFLTLGDGWPSEMNFQIRLHETTNQVELAYGPTRVAVNGRFEVGLRGFTTTDFINRTSGSVTTGSWIASAAGTTPAASMPLSSVVHPVNGLAYTFTPPAQAACAKPYSLVTDSLTGTTAQLHWRVNGGSGPYTVRYGVRGFNANTGGTVVANVPDTTLRITGLLPFTRYQFYVTQNCGGTTGASARSLAGEFTTTLLNDDPRGAFALPVTATCQLLRTSNANAITSPQNGYQNYPLFFNDPGDDNCSSNHSPQDVWFTFTTPATGPASRAVMITIQDTVTAVGAAGSLRVFASDNGWHGPFRQVDCAKGPTQQNGTVQPLVVANLRPSTTYYIAVAEYDLVVNPGPFGICVTYPPDCSDPLHVQVPYDSLTATSALMTLLPGAGNTSYTVTVTRAGATPYVLTPAPTTSPIVIRNLTPATDYSVSVQANCASGGPGTIKTFNFTTRPVNDEAPDATLLPVTATCQPLAGTIHGAHSSPGAACAWYDNVWYKVRTAASGPGSTSLRIRVSNGFGRVVGLQSSPGSNPAGPFTVRGCVRSELYPGHPTGDEVPPLDVTGLTINTTYFVTVARASYNAPDEPFTICATPLPTCLEPLAVTLGTVTTTTAAVSFMLAAGSQSTQVTAAPAAGFVGATVSVSATTSPTTLTGLTPGTPYVLTLQSSCGTGGPTSPSLVRYFNTKVANDEPISAIALPVTATCQPTAATTVLATRSVVNMTPATSCGASLVADVWFTFTTPATGFASHDVRIVVTGAAYEVRAFSVTPGAPPTYVGLACSAAPNTTPVSPAPAIDLAGLTPSTTYYISVTGFGVGAFGSGPFTICVTEPLNPCGEPSNLAATAITSTSATLTFSGGLNATGYTATYTPLAGGTAQTQSGLGSPLPLSGLTPATTYLATVVSNCLNSRASNPDSVIFTTPASCAAVTGLTASNLTPTTADLIFTATGPATRYTVAYGPVGGVLTTLAPPPTASPVALTGLTVGTAYTAYVVGQCPSGEVSDTVRVTFTTPLPPCPAITDVSTAAVTATTAEVRFTPSATATGYVVTLIAAGTGPQTQRGPSSPVMLTGLQPATAYAVIVAAECPGNQLSPASLPVVFTTQPLGVAPDATVPGLAVWPNPATSTVRISGVAEHTSVQLLDARGQLVQKATVPESGAVTLDLRRVPAGLYLLRTSTATRRLVKASE